MGSFKETVNLILEAVTDLYICLVHFGDISKGNPDIRSSAR